MKINKKLIKYYEILISKLHSTNPNKESIEIELEISAIQQ
mgnify:CR=1 FL=1